MLSINTKILTITTNRVYPIQLAICNNAWTSLRFCKDNFISETLWHYRVRVLRFTIYSYLEHIVVDWMAHNQGPCLGRIIYSYPAELRQGRLTCLGYHSEWSMALRNRSFRRLQEACHIFFLSDMTTGTVPVGSCSYQPDTGSSKYYSYFVMDE